MIDKYKISIGLQKIDNILLDMQILKKNNIKPVDISGSYNKMMIFCDAISMLIYP